MASFPLFPRSAWERLFRPLRGHCSGSKRRRASGGAVPTRSVGTRGWALLLLVWGMLITMGAAPPAKRPVILTTDCGTEVDDQWALVHLAISPEIDLKGVVTTHSPSLAPPAAESSARSAREVLSKLSIQPKPPVLAGSSLPLAAKNEPRKNAGVEFLLEQTKGHSTTNRLTVLIIGAATDVASALLIDRDCAERIEIVAMGFDGWPDGKDPWNVKNDIKAWQVVLESKAPIVVGDTAVTAKYLMMTREKAHTLLDGHGPGGAYLAQELDNWLTRSPNVAQTVTGNSRTWPIWDEVTVAYMLGMTTTRTYPRPTLGDDLRFRHDHSQGTISWVTRIDSDRLWADLVKKLDAANAPTR
jgi:inosine-uridine nucleoside N-ribohydrolase